MNLFAQRSTNRVLRRLALLRKVETSMISVQAREAPSDLELGPHAGSDHVNHAVLCIVLREFEG
jgi:hypothetical protein